ncbi:pyridoxal phosphate-dependent aminotransferase [Halorhodospira halochloris]|uniref:pyridoxal phosphate-dependent aminotransferase n=1 Tax=Halorhodospira halochloris TaxID=1052 RepID=UPI001EE86B51|nr:pyridoxal phosphate-dependent aminotransferase [Halorhodospira halochloris]MCG5530177.1 pyridoxal phosphate-dependent aminotransferase [Halorhodospira halochloris]
MEFKLADRVNRIKPSPTLAVTARAAELRAAGEDVIGLGAGEPDFDTPQHIVEAAIDAARNGQTRYTAVDGTAELKQAIIDKLHRDNQLSYSAKQILVSCGAKQSLFNLMAALLNDGDEVVIPAPYWVSYPDIALLFGAKPKLVKAGAESRFKISPQQLEEAITDKTRLVILNSPSNPTGTAYTKAELAELGSVLERYPQVVVASDDIYEHIIWREEPFSNIVNACPSLADRAVVVNGVSKAYAMTGWRIGYAAGPAPLIGAMNKVQSQSTSNPTSISQAASVAALNGDQGCIEPMLKAFKERHDFVLDKLNSMPGVSCTPCDGTFYCFPLMQEAMERLGCDDDVAFAEKLLNETGVALVPGSAFGLPGYARISYATSMENLEKAMERLHKALS